jgi:DNA-directed RNA polymerase specialized sigma24 family protein
MPDLQADLLYFFCRLQLPLVVLAPETFHRHLQRTFALHKSKTGAWTTWPAYLDHLYALDWYLAVACLEGMAAAWEHLFASRAGRADCLLMDALRARAARLYPRDEERQESAVAEFWSHLYVPESEGSLPVLARYDGQRPLVPWLIRVFQNWHISQLRRHPAARPLPEDDVALPLPADSESRWHDAFCQSAREWLARRSDEDLLLLGLRLRYRLSQREAANLLGIHEGTLSRRTDALSGECLEFIKRKLIDLGWAGDDLHDFIRTEMQNLVLDEPRLSADNLSRLLAERGQAPPPPAPAAAG